ncbi:MAG: DUF3575 domain-containing protein [Gelidibacter sp.]
MKNYYLILLLTLMSFPAFSQDEPQDIDGTINKNEVKLNALYMVLGAFEGSYEYLLNDESGLGITLFIPFDKEVKDDINYYMSPYYRFYFGNKYAAGFFLEGFGMLNSTNWRRYEVVNESGTTIKQDNVTDFALGVGLGGKWVTKRGLIGEINFGVGRNLFNSTDYDNDFVSKLGITVGYRF